MELFIFRDLYKPEELQKFREFALKYDIYRSIDLAYYRLNIDGNNYILTYDPIRHTFLPKDMESKMKYLLHIDNDSEFTRFMNVNADITVTKDIIEGINEPPEINFDKDILFYLVEYGQIISYVQSTMINGDWLYIQNVRSYIERKGYCKLICTEVSKEARKMGISTIKLSSEGGIAGHRCYIQSFLLSEYGYNRVFVSNRIFQGKTEMLLSKESAVEWLKNLAITIEADDYFEMEFFS